MLLEKFSNSEFHRGRPRVVEALWILISGVFVSSWLPGSAWRVLLLRLFGAKIGQSVVVKPRLLVKFPWRLSIGNHCWLGERLWIDNLADVIINDNVCISQGVYFCTGSHDWASITFDLVVKQINVESHVWVCARSSIGPGVTIREGAVVAMGCVISKDISSWTVHYFNNLEKKRTQK